MEIHGYTETGSIDATIDGIRMTVPDATSNRHRRMIAEWEADGNTIPPYDPPAPTLDELYPPLEPWQFWSIIELSGIGEQALRDAIDLIPDPAFKIKAKAKLANPPGGRYFRSDPLFSNAFLMMQLGKTAEEINAIWTAGAQLT